LSYLETHALEGTQEPFRVRLTCYHALRANRDARAEAILNTTYRLLQEHAARITDEELRRLFLEKVAVHKEILDRVEGERDVESAVVYVADQETEREDGHKPKEQLVEDLVKMRRRAAMLEAAQVRYRQIEETLWQSEKRFRSIAETAGDVIVIFNAKEAVLFWNKAAQDIFGYWASEVQGKLLTTILAEEFQRMFRREMLQVVATGISELMGKEIEVTAVRKNGSKFPLALSLITWRTKGEVFFTIIGNDITERKQAREALEQAYTEVERRVEERTSELQQEIAERGRLQQEIIESQKHTLQELSTPIIPVMEGIIIVPLIGSMDSMRAKDVTRTLLAGIREHRAQVVIVDITGVPVVDSGVADHLNKTIRAARLKGAHTIVTGISEAVAETVVDLGVDWGGIETLTDLQSGLRAALAKMGRRLDV
jgi:PAS domain S-box-containing protein